MKISATWYLKKPLATPISIQHSSPDLTYAWGTEPFNHTKAGQVEFAQVQGSPVAKSRSENDTQPHDL